MPLTRPSNTGLRRVEEGVGGGVLIESGNMAVVATNGNRTTTRGSEEVRRCGKRAGNGRIREKGEMNERRGVEVGIWAGLCVSREGIWYRVHRGASSSNDVLCSFPCPHLIHHSFIHSFIDHRLLSLLPFFSKQSDFLLLSNRPPPFPVPFRRHLLFRQWSPQS